MQRVQVVPGRELETLLIEDPVDVAAFGLELVRRTSGLSWWLVIPAAAFGARATLGRALLVANSRTKARHLGPLAERLSENSRAASLELSASGSSSEQRRALVAWLRRRRQILSECRAGHLQRNAYMYGFLAASISHVLGVRLLTSVDPSLALEGALWFPSLVASDPLIRLPLLAAGLSLWALGGPPARTAGLAAQLGFWSAAAGAVLAVPLCWAFAVPNAVSLHLLGASAFRLLQRFNALRLSKAAIQTRKKSLDGKEGKNLVWERD